MLKPKTIENINLGRILMCFAPSYFANNNGLRAKYLINKNGPNRNRLLTEVIY